jgi:ATP-dependent protease ClpP protease subunit
VDAKKDILMYINIARLEAVTGLGIYDTMQWYIESWCMCYLCTGLAFLCCLLAGGAVVLNSALPHSRMIHQPLSGGAQDRHQILVPWNHGGEVEIIWNPCQACR